MTQYRFKRGVPQQPDAEAVLDMVTSHALDKLYTPCKDCGGTANAGLVRGSDGRVRQLGASTPCPTCGANVYPGWVVATWQDRMAERPTRKNPAREAPPWQT